MIWPSGKTKIGYAGSNLIIVELAICVTTSVCFIILYSSCCKYIIYCCYICFLTKLLI